MKLLKLLFFSCIAMQAKFWDINPNYPFSSIIKISFFTKRYNPCFNILTSAWEFFKKRNLSNKLYEEIFKYSEYNDLGYNRLGLDKRIRPFFQQYNKIALEIARLKAKKIKPNPLLLKKSIDKDLLNLGSQKNIDAEILMQNMIENFKKEENKNAEYDIISKELENKTWEKVKLEEYIYKIIHADKKNKDEYLKYASDNIRDIYTRGKTVYKNVQEQIQEPLPPVGLENLESWAQSSYYFCQEPMDNDAKKASRHLVKKKVFDYLHKTFEPTASIIKEAKNLELVSEYIYDDALKQDAQKLFKIAGLLGEQS